MASPFMVEGKVIFGVDTDVLHINFQPLFSYHVGEDVVHKGLELDEHNHLFLSSFIKTGSIFRRMQMLQQGVLHALLL